MVEQETGLEDDEDPDEGDNELERSIEYPSKDETVNQEAKPDEIPDNMLFQATLDMMQLSEEQYKSRSQYLNPKDERMQKTEVAIFTWILKFAGIIESLYSLKSASDNTDVISEFGTLYEKSKAQELNEDEWSKLKKAVIVIAHIVLKAADVVISTPVQAQTDLLKHIISKHVVFDESSVLTHLELLCAWRDTETLSLVGDTNQLPNTVLTTPQQNPFAHVLSYGPFQRFTDIGLRVYTLRHVMRMTAG